jgi:hypothetical protein
MEDCLASAELPHQAFCPCFSWRQQFALFAVVVRLLGYNQSWSSKVQSCASWGLNKAHLPMNRCRGRLTVRPLTSRECCWPPAHFIGQIAKNAALSIWGPLYLYRNDQAQPQPRSVKRTVAARGTVETDIIWRCVCKARTVHPLGLIIRP